MSRNPNEPKIEIACAGCGRTQHVRPSKVIACDGYTCSLSSCKQNPDFRVPTPPEGFVCVIELYAAGGFSGWTIREASETQRQAVARARAIRDQALRGMIKQWAIYTLPDGTEVYAMQVPSDDRWKFCTLDHQPLFIEDDRRRGNLLQITLDQAAPCDLTLADLVATGKTVVEKSKRGANP